MTVTQELAEKNLAVGTWTNQKGEKHVSLTRMGRYNKNIAVPLDVLPMVMKAMAEKADELSAE